MKKKGWKKEIEEEDFVGWARKKSPLEYETLAIKKVPNYVEPTKVWAFSVNGRTRLAFSTKTRALIWAKAYMEKS